MAYELKAIFAVQDKATAKINQIIQSINKLDVALKRAATSALNLNNALKTNGNGIRTANNNVRNINNSYRTYNNTVNNTSNIVNNNTNIVNNNTNAIQNNITTINRYSSATSSMSSSVNRGAQSLGNLRNTLLGLASAYLTAQTATKAFNATIGAAAKYEQSEVAVEAIFNDKAASDAYLKLVDKMAIDSPLLNSGEMLGASKGLVAMTKNVEELGDAWSIIEKLMVLDPTQGTDGAAFALKEMWQGDSLSMVERFGLNKSELNRIKKLSIPKQIAEINKLLDGMGITEQTINRMGGTTLGYWAQIEERAGKFMRSIGSEGNSRLGESLGQVVEMFDTVDLDGIAARLGDKLAAVVDFAIEGAKQLWKWREPLMYIAGAFALMAGSIVTIMAIGALTSPIALISASIAGAATGFYALKNNSEGFNNILSAIGERVDIVKSKFKDMVDGAKIALGIKTDAPEQSRAAGNTGYTMMQDISPSSPSSGAMAFAEMFTKAIDWMKSAFEVAKNVFSKAKEVIALVIDTVMEKAKQLSPGIEQLKSIFGELGPILSDTFSAIWSIVGPILSYLWTGLKILGDIAVVAFNNIIVPAIGLTVEAFKFLLSVVSPVLTIIGGAIDVLGSALEWAWKNIMLPFVEFLMSGFKNALSALGEGLSVVTGWFEKVGGWADTARSYISQFADYISGIKLPDWITNGISTVVTTVGNFIGAGKGKTNSHYNGLDNVPYNGYNATLHKGEGVLTASENREYKAEKEGKSLGGAKINITGNTFNVRQESDIEKIAEVLIDKIESAVMQHG